MKKYFVDMMESHFSVSFESCVRRVADRFVDQMCEQVGRNPIHTYLPNKNEYACLSEANF